MPRISALPSHTGNPATSSQLVIYDPNEVLADNKTKQIPADTFALESDLTTLELAHTTLEGEHDALRVEFNAVEGEHDALRVEFDTLAAPAEVVLDTTDFVVVYDVSASGAFSRVPITSFSTEGDDLGSATSTDVAALFTGSGTYLKSDGTRGIPEADGIMVYPATGVARSTGSAWGTSYTVGVGANNLVQLNPSAQLPAVSAALLTNFPVIPLASGGSGGTTADAARTNFGITAIFGIGVSDANMGTFTGLTIPDSQTIKQALQALETAFEAFNTDFLQDTDNAIITGNWTFSGTVTAPVGTGLPAGGQVGDILMMTVSGPAWVSLADANIVTSEPLA